MLKKIIICVAMLGMVGCRSNEMNSGANPLNRSILFDAGGKLGLDIPAIPVPLPKIDLSLKFHYRRLSPQEEIDLELAKNGKFRVPGPAIDLPKVGPTPINPVTNAIP